MLHIELLRDQGIAILTPERKLEASDFERVGREIDPYIEMHGNINGVLIRGTFVRIEPHSLIEIAWGEAGNDDMPPGATRLTVRFTRRGEGTLVQLEHTGLSKREASKHAVGWPHFFQRLRIAGGGGDPGADPWATSPPSG